MSDRLTTMRQGANPAFEQGTSGHFDGQDLGYGAINKRCTDKLRLNILKGRWSPDTDDEVKMLRAYRESQTKAKKPSPEKFLEKWIR